MQSGNEIITLQFGNFANYLAAHYFNIQEAGFSYNRDFIPDILPHRLFRSSEDISTGTLLSFTPRTVLIDDVGGDKFSALPSDSDVENSDLPERLLDSQSSNIISHQKNNCFLDDLKKSYSSDAPDGENSAASPFFLFKSHYNLENVTCWSEFMKTALHQRSKNSAPKQIHLSSLTSFHHHGTYSCSNDIAFWEQLEDSIRFFAEECDNLQGFQIMSEGHTGFSGVATSALHYLKDEYGKRDSIFFPTFFYPENTTNHQMQISSCNTVSCFADAKDSVDLIVPISLHIDPWCRKDQLTNRTFKNIEYKSFDRYENSAVLAAGLELITLPYRMRGESNISLSEYCRINSLGRCISVAGTVIPFPVLKEHSLNKVFLDWSGRFFECISPRCTLDNTNLFDMMYTFSKGITSKTRSDVAREFPVQENCEELDEILKSFIQLSYCTRSMKTFFSEPRFRVPPSFPNIFNNIYNLTNPDMAEYGSISEFYGIGCLVSSKEVESLLNILHKRAAENFRKIFKKTEESSDIDFRSSLDIIASLAGNYSDSVFL